MKLGDALVLQLLDAVKVAVVALFWHAPQSGYISAAQSFCLADTIDDRENQSERQPDH